MTRECLSNLLNLKRISKIHVFIDGPRKEGNSQEFLWRDQTIEIASQLASNHSKISLKVWDSNIGLEENSERSFAPLFENFSKLIVTEEDVHLDQSSIDFLVNLSEQDAPVLATAYSQSSHKKGLNQYRTTLFPQLWGAMYSREIFEGSLKVRRAGQINERLVQHSIMKFFPAPTPYRARLIRHWIWYFNYALKTHRHPDVLLQYASWELGQYAKAPLERLSKDVSSLDNRGMNVRHSIPLDNRHDSGFVNRENFQYCPKCEKESSRQEINTAKYILKGIQRKFS